MKRKFKVDPQVRLEVYAAIMFLFAGAVFLNTDYRPDGVYVIADYTDGVREHAFYHYEDLSKSYNGQHDEALRIAGIEDEYYMTQEYQL